MRDVEAGVHGEYEKHGKSLSAKTRKNLFAVNTVFLVLLVIIILLELDILRLISSFIILIVLYLIVRIWCLE